jgi:hypothetical protein
LALLRPSASGTQVHSQTQSAQSRSSKKTSSITAMAMQSA